MTEEKPTYEVKEPFKGFVYPQENYSKLPHMLTESLPEFTSLAELKVVMYILRHTWGYQEFDEGKRISTNEFRHGRKKRGGERIDRGIGMAKKSVIDGLRRAVEHGFIEVEVDASDGGRVTKYYHLRMQPDIPF